MKTCAKCKEPKPDSEFGPANSKDGLHWWCRPCHREYRNRWGATKPKEYFRIRNTEWRKGSSKHRVTVLFNGAKKRAVSKELDFDLTREWIIQRLEAGVCEVTGLPFDFSSSVYRPTIDRREPEKGYVQSNCQMVIWGYNVAKFDFGHEALVEWVSAWNSRRPRLEDVQRRGVLDDSGE